MAAAAVAVGSARRGLLKLLLPSSSSGSCRLYAAAAGPTGSLTDPTVTGGLAGGDSTSGPPPEVAEDSVKERKGLLDAHTAKWMQNTSLKSPMERIWAAPPIKVHGMIAACEGGTDPAVGHPLEFIQLLPGQEAICKYCGLRYFPDTHAH
eukprot:jgi/Chlat1/8844/Chrsp91S08183